ncbi:hypothetical protein D3C85_1393910 [compost metagenome]
MPEMSRPRTTAEQTVNRGDIGRNFIANGVGDSQRSYLLADGLRQPRCGFAGRCGEANAQRLASLHGRRLEQRQQAHDRRGLAGSRTTGDDTESAASGEGTSEFLPVDQLTRSDRAEQTGEALKQVIRSGFVCCQTLTQ